jgi:ribosomal protein S18 acetylase RimI-like enzyme
MTPEQGFDLRPIREPDREQIARFLVNHWGSEIVVSRGVLHRPAELPGFVAFQGKDWLGVVTYHVVGDRCEMVTLDSLAPGRGIGTALITAVREAAVEAGCKRLWLITTNDNLNALRFYQKRGFALVAVHRNALKGSRQLKPEIPEIGMDGIPLRDEIELELVVGI